MKVPKWIKNSEVYKDKSYKNFEKKDIPVYELIIEKMKDFKNILKVLNFWKINKPLSYEIWEFIFSNKKEVQTLLEKKFNAEINKYFLGFINKKRSLCNYAIENNELECLKYLRRQKYTCNAITFNFAARYENLDIIKYLNSPDGKLKQIKWNNGAIFIAAKNGNLEFLKYLNENKTHENNLYSDSLIESSCNGHLECVIYLCENDHPKHFQAIIEAAKNGFLEILKYFNESDKEFFDRYKNQAINNVVHFSTNDTDFLCFKYLQKNGAIVSENNIINGRIIDQNICFKLTLHDNLKWLKYFHENNYPWDESITEEASKKDNLKILKYAVENNCPINIDECVVNAKNKIIKNYLLKIKLPKQNT